MAIEDLRVDLPSGGWWNLLTAPRWKQVRRWSRLARDGSGTSLADAALVDLTTGWSFVEEVSAESLALRDFDDLVAVMDAFRQKIAPRLIERSAKDVMEGLFAAMIAGNIPAGFAEVHLMASTGWSWRELQQTPVDVVMRMAAYLAVCQTRINGGSLEFPGPEE